MPSPFVGQPERDMQLRPATPRDFPFIRQIAQDPENSPFITDEPEEVLQSYLDGSRDLLLIADEDGVPVGYGLFGEIGEASGRVELRRLGLALRDGGRGRRFLGGLIDYGFEVLGAKRIWLDASGENSRAMALYQKMGFRREGILRQHWYRPALGRVVDLHLFGMLREDWAEARAEAEG